MKIEIGKYTLYSDDRCYWVEEEQPIDREEHKRAKYDTKQVRAAGYSTTIPILLRSFRENKLKMSDATSMTELIEDIAKLAEDLQTMDKAIMDSGIEEMRRKYGQND